MELAVGAIVEGKVTGITKFGAFVSLPGGKSGMVHISEIAHAYVNDINEHLKVGQDVKVKIIAIDPAGKINLSIKQTTEAPARQNRGDRQYNRDRNNNSGDRQGNYSRPRNNNGERSGDRNNNNGGERSQQRSNNSGDRGNRSYDSHRQNSSRSSASKEPQSFDDMLKQFMADSDSKISSIKQYSEHRTSRKRRQ